MFFLLKTVVYLSSIFPSVVDVAMSEKHCNCVSIPIIVSKGYPFLCSKGKNQNKKCNDFFQRLDSCLLCMTNWKNPDLLLSSLRIFFSTLFLIRGNYIISDMILSTTFVKIPELILFFEKNFFKYN